MNTISADEQFLEDAWQELSKTLEQSRTIVTEATRSADSLDRVEGYRHVLRLLHHAMEDFIEYADPLRTSFRRVMTSSVKFFGDNPDVFYDNARIEGSQTYRISGNRGTVAYLGFIIYRKTQINRVAFNISDSDITVAPDGSFEIILSPDKKDGNWFQLDPLASDLMARQYFLDMENEVPATYEIECIGDHAVAPPPLDSRQLAKGVAITNRFLPSVLKRTVKFTDELLEKANTILPFDPLDSVIQTFSPTSDNQYTVGAWRLQKDEALEITVTPPNSIYWSIQLWNRWFESLEFRYHPVSINKKQAHLEPDGTFKTVIAHQDPGVPNWLDTTGHIEGLIGLRWMICDDIPEPQCRLVKLADL
jgi:hypothetical protein